MHPQGLATQNSYLEVECDIIMFFDVIYDAEFVLHGQVPLVNC